MSQHLADWEPLSSLRSGSSHPIPAWSTTSEHSDNTAVAWSEWTNDDEVLGADSTATSCASPKGETSSNNPFEQQAFFHDESYSQEAEDYARSEAILYLERTSLSGPLRSRSLRSSSQASPSHQPYPNPSSGASPKPRSPLRIHVPPPLGKAVGSTSSSSLFLHGSPSPFRHATPLDDSDQTMDPAHSVHSSSCATSLSSLTLARLGSASTASSVYDAEGSNRGRSVASRKSATPQRSLSALGRNGTKKSMASRKSPSSSTKSPSSNKPKITRLTNSIRKAICRRYVENPSIKQKALGDLFDLERSTVSKILKDKEKWLAISDNEEEGIDSPSFSSYPRPASHRSRSSVSVSPHPSPPTGSQMDTIDAAFSPRPLSSALSSLSISSGGRYAELEERLFDWARHHVDAGGVLSDEALSTQALVLAQTTKRCGQFKAGRAWLLAFKQRASIVTGTFIPLLSLEDQQKVQIKSEFDGDDEDEIEDEELGEMMDTKEDIERDSRDADFRGERRSPRRSSRKGASSSSTVARGKFSAPPLDQPASIVEEHLNVVDHDYTTSYPAQPFLHSLQPGFQSINQPHLAHYPTYNNSLPGMMSPGRWVRHNRSDSTSTTSSISGLTAFSTQSGSGTPHTGSLHGSFAQSLPSTPGPGKPPGYYTYGPEGNQSKLEAGWATPSETSSHSHSHSHSHSLSRDVPSPQIVHPPCSAGSTSSYRTIAPYPSTRVTRQSVSIDQAVSLEQARQGLEAVIKYITTEGQEIVLSKDLPKDLVQLLELKTKMDTASRPPSPSSNSSPRKLDPPCAPSSTPTTGVSYSPQKYSTRQVRSERNLLAGQNLEASITRASFEGGEGMKFGMETRRSTAGMINVILVGEAYKN